MFRLALAPLALCLILAYGTSASANSVTVPSDATTGNLKVDLGRNDFMTYCAPCHGVEGRGDGTVAEFLTIPAADLTQLTKKNMGNFPRERMTEVIDGRREVKVHGARDMPVWGDWFDKEADSTRVPKKTHEEIVGARIEALVNYIETIQEK